MTLYECDDKEETREVKSRIIQRNHALYSNNRILQEENMDRTITVMIHKTLIKRIIRCVSDSWRVTKKNGSLGMFKRKIYMNMLPEKSKRR